MTRFSSPALVFPEAPASVAAAPYKPPALLRDVHLLDLLELTGSCVYASRHLWISQPTASRRYQRLAEDFGLRRDKHRRLACRFGVSPSIRGLRQAGRAHRLEAGVIQVATDLFHQDLLDSQQGVLSLPARFRSAAEWCVLVQEAVVEAALVSSLELEEEELAALGPSATAGVIRMDLGPCPLRLRVAPGSSAGRGAPVLVPPQLPEPQRNLIFQGLSTQEVSALVQETAHWLEQLNSAPLAVAVPERPNGAPLWGGEELRPLAGPARLQERLWLLVAEECANHLPVLHLLKRLRRDLTPALTPD